MSHLPAMVEISEVGPRDGLQGLPRFVPTERKVRFVEDLLDAGLTSVEIVSFVSPKAIPQMRDGREVAAAVRRRPGVRFSAFVPNAKGLEAALAAGIDRASAATYASEEFARRNVNATIEESTERIREMVRAAQGTPLVVRGYVSCAIACPFSGPVAPERVAELAAELLEAGCEDVFLADTTGEGTAATVGRVVDAVLARVPGERLGIHFHDTFGQGLANVVACLERGIAKLDASVAGLGGCPTAEGAAGNVATEDVLVLLRGFGIEVPIDLERLARAGAALCRDLGIRSDSKAGRAIAARRDESRRDS